MHRELRHGGLGWAQPISAQRQEFDVSGAFNEVLAVQDLLDRLPPGALTAESYSQLYERALSDVRAGTLAEAGGSRLSHALKARTAQDVLSARGDDDLSDGWGTLHRSVREATDELLLFGAQASVVARDASAERTVVAFACPDAVGVVASASRIFAAAGVTIERSVMTIIGGHTLTAFLVATPPGTNVVRLEAQLERGLAAFGGSSPQFIPAAATRLHWARPRASFYQLTARHTGSGSLLAGVTATLAALGWPIVLISARSDRSADTHPASPQSADIQFAAPSDADDFVLDPVRTLAQTLRTRVPDTHVTIVPLTGLMRDHPLPDGPTPRPTDHLLLLCGHARPGFADSILRRLAETGYVHEICAVSMVALADICVFAAVVGDPLVRSLADRGADLVSEVRSALANAGFGPVKIQFGPAAPRAAHRSADARTTPTHELRLEVGERTGVIAILTDELRRHDANVVWLSSRVLKPRFGEAEPRCVVEMHIHVRPEAAAALDGRLRTLASTAGWEMVALRPWSLSGGLIGNASGLAQDRGRNAEPSERPRDIRLAADTLADIKTVVQAIPAVVDRSIEAGLRPEELVPFSGYVGVDVLQAGKPMVGTRDEDAVPVHVGEAYALRASLSHLRPGARFERIVNISGGPPFVPVTFVIVVDSDTIDFDESPIRVTLTNGDDDDASVELPFAIPPAGSRHWISVQVRQRNRTIQIVPVQLMVVEEA